MRTAISLRSVAIVILPGDLALQESVSNRPFIPFGQHKATVCPSKEEIAKLAEVLNSAQKVTILGGAGCPGAHSELVQVAGLLQPPIVKQCEGRSSLNTIIRMMWA